MKNSALYHSAHPYFNRRTVLRFNEASGFQSVEDDVATEAPLSVILVYGETGVRQKTALYVTMRTPGDDFDLARGLLFSEGVIQSAADIVQIRYAGHTDALAIELAPHVPPPPENFQRYFTTNAACGICGKKQVDTEDLVPVVLPRQNGFWRAKEICAMPALLAQNQRFFASTGGVHAVGLVFREVGEGPSIVVCEDVGRHNAMDKLIGAMLRQNALPLHNCAAIFSGRLSYELTQKAAAAGIPALCSIGAPSSIAIETAEAYGMTVAGFVRATGFNLYCGAWRVRE